MLAVVRALADAADPDDREAALQRARDAYRLLDAHDRGIVTPLAQAVANAAPATTGRRRWARC